MRDTKQYDLCCKSIQTLNHGTGREHMLEQSSGIVMMRIYTGYLGVLPLSPPMTVYPAVWVYGFAV